MASNTQGHPRRRRRAGTNRISDVDHTKSSSSIASSSLDSDTYASSPEIGSERDRQYQLQHHDQHRTIASPPKTSTMMATTSTPSQAKDKQRAQRHDSDTPPSALSSVFQQSHSPLGPSMLSSSSYKSINLSSRMSHGDSDEPARLITYTKHSQGFTWNDELFLPSYLVNRHRYGGGYRGGMKRHTAFDGDGMDDDDGIGDFDEQTDSCPVTDIFVTDEEAAAMMP